MRRSRPNKSRSGRSFKNRASKTEKINLALPRRGGIRL